MMPNNRRTTHRPARQWRPSMLSVAIAVLGFLGLAAVTYPTAAQWASSINQSQVVSAYGSSVESAEPSAEKQLAEAREYNSTLSSGAVLAANARVPSGTGAPGVPGVDYRKLLRVNEAGLMARLIYPAIRADLPIYHGTADSTLLRGAGHLEGTSLPVGGATTHSVITAHRGLANAVMFTNLDQAKKGDRFSIDVFGEVLSYRVTDVRVVEPDETDTLRAVQSKDLVTLVTCTPLGVNTHRILVTGERVMPTPAKDIRVAEQQPGGPGFPWWAVWFVSGIGLLCCLLWFAGRADARVRALRRFSGR